MLDYSGRNILSQTSQGISVPRYKLTNMATVVHLYHCVGFKNDKTPNKLKQELTNIMYMPVHEMLEPYMIRF